MSPIRINTFTFRKAIICGSIIIVVLLFGAYVSFQARFLILGPQLTLISEPKTVQKERQITLEGTAKNIVKITLNGRSILTNERGDFKELVTLENGYTIVTIEATDRYGRSKTLQRPFVYKQSEISLFN